MSVSVIGDADATRFSNRLQPRGDIHAIAVDPSLVIDDVTEVDADTELHAPIRRDIGIPLSSDLLNGDRALNRIHHTTELSKDTVTGGGNDASTVVGNHRQNHSLVAFEVPDRTRFVSAHKGTVPRDVGGEDGGQLPGSLRVSSGVRRHQPRSALVRHTPKLPHSE